jgi:hypothetical protein
VREPCLRDDALAALEIELAGLGRLDLACRAVQETQPDRLFQAADPSGLADGAKHHEVFFARGHWLIASSLAREVAGRVLRWLEGTLGGSTEFR